MNNLNQIWKNICQSILINEDQKLAFDLMIADTNLEKIDNKNNTFIITTKNKIDEAILKSDFLDILSSALNNYYQEKNYKLLIFSKSDFLKKDKDNVTKEKNDTNENTVIESHENLNLNSDFTFENFIASKTNDYLFKAAKSIARGKLKNGNPFFIHGKSGLGKTHLLNAIGNLGFELKNYKNIKYIESKDFGNIVVKALTSKNVNENIEKIKDEFNNYDLLLVDDIQYMKGKEKTKEIFFYIFESFIKKNNKKQIVFTSDQEPEELINFEDRFITRFKSGLLLTIAPPDTETAVLIIKSKMNKMNKKVLDLLSEEAIKWIAINKGKDNIRFLEGALNKLLFYTIDFDENQKIGISEILEIFNESNLHKNKVTKDNILSIVAEYFGLPKKEILSSTRKKEIVTARNIAIFLMRDLLDDSLIEIGNFFKRDHSTIVNSIKNVNNSIKDSNNKMNEIIMEIRKKL